MFTRLQWIIITLSILGLLLLPWLLDPFNLVLLTEILLMGLFALSFNLLFGYTGLLSFGHAAYFATGAYVCGYLVKHSVPFLLAILAGVIAAFILATGLGYLSVRLDRIYFAMLTLAFGMMVYTIIFQWREVTGGSDGITGILVTDLGIPGISFKLQGFATYYYFSLILVAIATYLLWRIAHSPFGELLQASRENAQRLLFVGVDVRQLRWVAFILAGSFAGLAGALWSPFQRVANPEIAHWTFSTIPVLMTILGGYHRFAGPLVGATLFIWLEHWLQSNQRYFWQWLASLPLFPDILVERQLNLWHLFLGLLLIPLILGFPGGVLASVEKIGKSYFRQRSQT